MDRYVAWMTIGYCSSTGDCFDIGNTTLAALRRYQVYGNPYSGSPDPLTAGNGSIMRLAPVPMFFYPDQAAAISYAGESSLTTHGAPECIDACCLLGTMIFKALAGKSKEEILSPPHFPPGMEITLSPRIQALAEGSYRDKRETMLAGAGYVVKCLETALWCFDHTADFRAAVLRAANFGDDADTTAAVCGQLAGAHYGEEGIPAEWLARLAKQEEITRLADRLYAKQPHA
jgi:ADP-ribosyl-[dinitrogen reductase] hydrolase